MKKLSYLRMLLASLPVVFMLHFPARAQNQDEDVLKAIQKEIEERYGKKVEEVLKKDQARFNKMKSELEEIDKIKDNNGKKKGLENYKKGHRAHYEKAVKEAGVDLNTLVKDLEKKFTDYSFSLTDDFSIQAYPRRRTNEEDAGSGVSSSGPGVASTGITTSQILSFTQQKSVNCALGSGGNVELGTRHVRAWTTGVVAGGCSSKGTLENYTNLPATGVQSIKLRLNYTLEISGYALGIFGTSITKANSTFLARITDPNTHFSSGYLDKYAIAPVLWYASFNEFKNFTPVVDLTAWKGKTIQIHGSAYSYSVSSICCATNSNGKVTINTATLEIAK
jgi:hypothetical protein